MKRYLVREISKATDKNLNFAGMTSIAYYGKDQELIACLGDAAKATYTYHIGNSYMIRDYGYSRMCDAKKSWIYRYPENTEFWNSEVSIVEFTL